ncbi:hypothetical protein HDU76_012304 [Blyttiomyces sp. JEL0837]|nr:hypothetical protein HDU76_012304 [Blyttiomyces sp. JEL0837]
MSAYATKEREYEGDPKISAAQVEAEIPDELKETPPLENVAMLDKRFDELLAEIKILQDSRGKDFQNVDARKDRLSTLPNIIYFENFRHLRQERLDAVSKVDPPLSKESASEAVRLEVRKQAKHPTDTQMDNVKIYQHLQGLKAEYVDTVNRFERISENLDVRIKRLQQEAAQKEAERIAAERSGLTFEKKVADKSKSKIMNVAREALKIKKLKEKETREQAEREAKEILEKDRLLKDEKEAPDDMKDPGFEPSDLAIYLRWLIATFKNSRDINIYLRKASMMVHTERVQLLRDYKLVLEIGPGQNLMETLEHLEGINLFMESAPIKAPKVEDFLTEFEILCAHYKIETPIVQEDGRPFAYEIEGRFSYKVSEQILETNFVPCEPSDVETSSPSTKQSGSGGAPNINSAAATTIFSNIGYDSKSASLAAAVTAFNNNGIKIPTAPRIKTAEWVHTNQFGPEKEDWQEAQEDLLKSRTEIDFETLCEFDLICCNDIETVNSRLKETSRKIWEYASRKSNAKPLILKAPSLSKPGSHLVADPESESDEVRRPQTFDLSMMVPDGRERLSDRKVLDGKKQHFGQILRANDEARMVEQELLNVDPNRTTSSLTLIEPTVATIFAEHEVMSFVQLRYLRLRELRDILRRQLNFMRSIEKRINLDIKNSQLRVKTDQADPTRPTSSHPTPGLAAQMLSQKTHFDGFEAMAAGYAKIENQNPQSSSAAAGTNQNKEDSKSTSYSTEDIRIIRNGRIHIFDNTGTSIIYADLDAALEDLKVLEKTLLKIATIYINRGLNGKEAISSSYIDELRFKMSDRRTELKDATYLNPNVDRVQTLAELYAAEVRFQYSKIDVINAYMEAYEHATDIDTIRKLGKIITSFLHLRPHYDFEASYFSKCYTFTSKGLELQANLVKNVISHSINGKRDWMDRFRAKLSEKDEAGVQKSADRVPSPFQSGLPVLSEDLNDPIISMHQSGINVSFCEMIPSLTEVYRVWKVAKKNSINLYDLVETLNGVDTQIPRPSRPAVECTIWKNLTSIWDDMVETDFSPPTRGRRLIGGLDSDVWLENPLLPDLILSERYIPYDLPNEGNARTIPNTISPYNMYTDPPFKPFARDILSRLLKTVVLRYRLLYSWIETEFWKTAFEDQFPQMGVNKAAYAGRLGALRYDIPEMADSTVVEDDDLEDFDNTEVHADAIMDTTELAHPNSETRLWRVGPLAIAELDEGQSMYDFSKLPTTLSLIRLVQMHKLSRALKQARRKSKVDGMNEANSQKFDVDYRTLVASILPKKKQMRKAMMLEFVKE